MSRTLTFTQITDTRWDDNIRSLIENRITTITRLLENLDGVTVRHNDIYECYFEGENNAQCRCDFFVRKDTRKVSWNDIYKIINSVYAVPYRFI